MQWARRFALEHDEDQDARVQDAWVDLATVTVPSKTRRQTVLEKAVKEKGIQSADPPLVFRVLDEESARTIPVEWEQPPPQLKIG